MTIVGMPSSGDITVSSIFGISSIEADEWEGAVPKGPAATQR